MRTFPYFFSTFCVDIILFSLNYGLFMVMVNILDIKAYTEANGEMTVAFMLFGLTMVW